MTLIDRDRRRVALNDAALQLFDYRSDEVVGTMAGDSIQDDDPTLVDRLWAELVRTNEVYAEHLVSHRNGKPMRVGLAAHRTTIGGRWMALLFTLSARFEPDGPELIGTNNPKRSGRSSKLTAREREVIRRVALGAGTERIATELYLSPATVRTHVRNAMVKTRAHTRAQMVAIALADGLLD